MQKFSVDAVLFDLDGTVADTLDDLKNSVNYAVGLCGVAPYDRETVRSFIGSGAANLIRSALPGDVAPEKIENTLAEFRRHYMEHVLDNTKPYSGVLAMLWGLKKRGFKLALVSNKPDSGTQAIASALFGGIFDFVLGERAGTPRKPEPDMVRLALSSLGTDSAVYVGDSDVDVKTAANAGLPCLCVTWGFRSVDQLRCAGAENFISSVEELSEAFERR